MIDFSYIVAAVAFFAAMLAYIAGCHALGAGASGDDKLGS